MATGDWNAYRLTSVVTAMMIYVMYNGNDYVLTANIIKFRISGDYVECRKIELQDGNEKSWA